MVVIAPLRGILYEPRQVSDLAQVVAPPYDAITPQEQEELYQRHPYNVVRLILGQGKDREDRIDNRYLRAVADFTRWRHTGILRRDPLPALYPYEQTFALEDGKEVRRLGFLALTRLEDLTSGAVLPHERTLAGPKADRLRLLETCQANFCPVFALYSEPTGRIQSELEAGARPPPVVAFTDAAGIAHRLWRITDPAAIERIGRIMADRVIYIADGHHRYETALTYRDARRRLANGNPGDEPYEFILMYLANMEAPGITILSFHRLLRSLPDFQPAAFLDRLAERFTVAVRPVPDRRAALPEFSEELRKRGGQAHSFGLGFPRQEHFFLVSLDPAQVATAIRGDLAPALKQLDVTVLHELILQDLLGIRRSDLQRQRFLTYIPSASRTLEELDRPPSQMAFWLNPARLEQVRAVAQAREAMPQKSTFFYPKPVTGLVIYTLDGAEAIRPPVGRAPC